MARLLKLEVAVERQLPTLSLCWDIQKFYDHIVIPLLITAAKDHKIPLVPFLLGFWAHTAPRAISLNFAISFPIIEHIRSMLAGCSLSNDLARLYFLTDVDIYNKRNPHFKLHQHVDDMSQTIIGTSNEDLINKASSAAIKFVELTRKLLLPLSANRTIVGNKHPSERLLQILEGEGCHVKLANVVPDLGLPNTAGRKRSIASSHLRLEAGDQRCHTISIFSQIQKGRRPPLQHW